MSKFISTKTWTSLSPIIAALSSYGINLVAASTLISVLEFSEYLELQAWSIYFSTVSTLCIIDLKLNPNGEKYKTITLLGLSIISSFIFLVGLCLFSLLIGNEFFLIVAIVGFFYAIFRGMLMVGLIIRIPKIPITMRIIRSLLLILLGGSTLVGFIYLKTATHFILVQGIAAAIPFFLYFPRIYKFCFINLLQTLLRVYRLDRVRLFRRNLSYFIDMAQNPLFYVVLSGLAIVDGFEIFVYLFGLILPLSFLVNQIIAERIRLYFAIDNISNFICKLKTQSHRIRFGIIFFRIIYIVLITFGLLSCFEIIDYALGMIICIVVQMLFICASSCSSLIIAKLGMEALNISIITPLTILLIILSQINAIAPVAIIVATMLISSKYLLQQNIAYSRLNKYKS